MKLDLDFYRVHVKFIREFIPLHPGKTPLEIINLYLGPGSPPLVAMGYYMIEILGEDPEVRDMINRLTKFYRYNTITGICE